MKYRDGADVRLGDVVNVPVPVGRQRRGSSCWVRPTNTWISEPSFITWVKKDKVLKPTSIVVEWLGAQSTCAR